MFSNVLIGVASFALVADAQDPHPLTSWVEKIGGEVAASASADDELTQTTTHRPTHPGLVGQHRETIQHKDHQLSGKRIARFPEKRFELHQIVLRLGAELQIDHK